MKRLPKKIKSGIKKLMSAGNEAARPRTASLVQSRFSVADARLLLTELFRVKIAFHEKKLALGSESPDELLYSRQRIAELRVSLRNALEEVAFSDGWVDITATIQVAAVLWPSGKTRPLRGF